MGNVITVSAEHWKAMLVLKDNVKKMSLRNGNGTFDECLRKERGLFKTILEHVTQQ